MTITVPFMHAGGQFSYGENDQLQLIALPYAGRRLEMIILLPRSRDGMGQLETGLTAASLSAWTSEMRDQEVNVALPKFKMSSGFGLGDTLRALGMKDAFDPEKADFSGMDGSHWLYLSAVLHKAYIDVNEKGTEAAAATAVSVRGWCGARRKTATRIPGRSPVPFPDPRLSDWLHSVYGACREAGRLNWSFTGPQRRRPDTNATAW